MMVTCKQLFVHVAVAGAITALPLVASVKQR